MKILLPIIACIALNILNAGWTHANDSAVETSVGGLKLRKEHSVSMEKERLFISPNLVTVEYEFRNTSKAPVSSEVAFPIPPYSYAYNDTGGDRDFADFKAWIDGKPIKIEKEVRAFVKGREVTKELRQAGITIERFGNFDPSVEHNEIYDLKPNLQNQLVKVGALKAPDKKERGLDFWPEWETHIKYHWRQEFPPGAIVKIKHEYKPVRGFRPVQVQAFKQEFPDTCINTETFGEVKRRVAARMKQDPLSNNYFGATWVSYILTTTNTWQTPIKDFELVVQGENDDLITFCWNGVIEKTGDLQVKARKTDFIPNKELKIYFLRNY